MSLSQKNPFTAQVPRPGIIYTQRGTDYARIIQTARPTVAGAR